MNNLIPPRSQFGVLRLENGSPNIVPVHLLAHASWLNQIEIYFSGVQRKVLTPDDFSLIAEVEDRILAFRSRYEEIARAFEWRFTRKDLSKLLKKLELGPKRPAYLVRIRQRDYEMEH